MSIKTCLTRLSLILLLCALSACDGGIFGTGDGSNNIQIIGDSDGGVPEENETDSEAPDTIGNDAAPETEEDTNTDALSESETVSTSFENLQVGTTSTTPGIHLINVSDRSITVFNETTGANVFAGPVLAGSVSDAAAIQIGDNNIVISETDNNTVVASIRPLSAGTSTLTTLIVRNTDDSSLDVVKLSSTSISLTPTMAQVRVVQASVLGATDTSATFMLLPAGENPGGSAILFNNVSNDSAADASYQIVAPGDYRLVDSLSRVDAASLSVEAGKVYTLIIQQGQDTPVLIHEDDQLSF